MKKHLVVLNGPMGVGKTAVGKRLADRLAPALFLDGDWCWDLHPFTVTADTKALVLKNIRAFLENGLACPAVEALVFVWVLQEEAAALELLAGLEEQAEILRVTLEAGDAVLAGRVSRDIAAGKRAPGSVERSLSYQKFYPGQRTLHLDTSRLTPEEAAAAIAGLLGR